MRSGEDLSQHLCRLDPRELHVQPLSLDRKSVVIDPKAVEHRGVKLVNSHGVLSDVVGELVRLPVRDAPLNSAPCQPHAEAARVMVPAVLLMSQLSLAIDSPA